MIMAINNICFSNATLFIRIAKEWTNLKVIYFESQMKVLFLVDQSRLFHCLKDTILYLMLLCIIMGQSFQSKRIQDQL